MTFPIERLQAALPPIALHWVPIRSLAPRHRPRILAHLLALSPRDRYLRFGYLATDSQIGHYVDQIDFDRDEVFGVFNRRLEVVAIAHLAFLGTDERTPSAAEFGVSVAERARGRGWGARLFERAALHARNRHVDTLLIHALAENTAMLRIARNAGAQIQLEGLDALARVKLPAEDFASHVQALLERQAAELDYGLKLQAKRFNGWLHLPGSEPAPADAPGSREAPAAAATQARDSGTPPPV
jgi:GNAT superfamily N-acetyltransferase